MPPHTLRQAFPSGSEPVMMGVSRFREPFPIGKAKGDVHCGLLACPLQPASHFQTKCFWLKYAAMKHKVDSSQARKWGWGKHGCCRTETDEGQSPIHWESGETLLRGLCEVLHGHQKIKLSCSLSQQVQSFCSVCRLSNFFNLKYLHAFTHFNRHVSFSGFS